MSGDVMILRWTKNKEPNALSCNASIYSKGYPNIPSRQLIRGTSIYRLTVLHKLIYTVTTTASVYQSVIVCYRLH